MTAETSNARELVAKWRTLANEALRRSGTWNGNDVADRIEFMADELEAALAAEGVQAGEVWSGTPNGSYEIGYGWDLERYGFPTQHEPRPVPVADGYWTPWHVAQERIASALSQQPEARGVVRHDLCGCPNGRAEHSPSCAALTEARNVR